MWQVTVDHSWDEARPRWRPLLDLPQATPFQTERWLSCWYETFSERDDVEPLLVHVARADGAPALALPLIVKAGALKTVEFADLGITDYNAPLLGLDAPRTKAEAVACWRAIRAALPAADLVLFSKVMTEIDGRPNPITEGAEVQPSNLFGNLIRIDTDWEGWLRSLEKGFRKELGRCWRVFTRDESARFVITSDCEEAMRIYHLLELQQGERIRGAGLPYLLDEPDYSAFYRDLIVDGLDDGSVILSALMAGDELVGGLLGVRRGDHYAMIRISAAIGQWSNCSPGRLVIERTMAALFDQGVRTFDFTIGDYAHKRAFDVAHVPLVDIHDGLSWRAWPTIGTARAKAYVKRRPGLERLIRRVIKRAA